MTTLHHHTASPRADRSESRAIAETFLDTYRDVHPDHVIEHFDLWDGSLPAFGPAAADAKMAVFAGHAPSGDGTAAWAAAQQTFDRFAAVDKYLFSVPMWNAGIPYILKQFIDVISQPGMVFGFDPVEGYTGLVTGKKAAVAYTGAVYGAGRGPRFGSDFQMPYMRDWLQWAGVHEIEFRPNLATVDADSGRQAAHARARDLAKVF